MITGKVLKEWGFPSGPLFGEALSFAQYSQELGADVESIKRVVLGMIPKTIEMRKKPIDYVSYLNTETEDEKANDDQVRAHMDALLRLPTVVKAAVMPDACPAGQQMGTIPVGGVVSTRDAIHPSFHSADICCSMFLTVLGEDEDLKYILDTAMKVTHFGPGGRKDLPMSKGLHEAFKSNMFLKDLCEVGDSAMGTQGDGNHFLFVGSMKSTNSPAIVTHHGSRNVGAQLYKKGMAVAQRQTKLLCPDAPSHNAWIDANSKEGIAYWEALQIVRAWTMENHSIIHQSILDEIGTFKSFQVFNEHNFVFKKDGLFYHAKGATPSYDGGPRYTLIPMNMSEPIMLCKPTDGSENLGFAPHGAGRNMSRKAHIKGLGDDKAGVFEAETRGLDVRSFSGVPDLSELPSAYKDAPKVRSAIVTHDLARVIDEVIPYGCIMAGEQKWERKRK